MAQIKGENSLPGVEVKGALMTQCEVCGNEYDKTIEVIFQGERHTFDSFECAIQALAPRCAHCGCRIIGHGLEARGQMFCCANCAAKAGVTGMKDRLEPALATAQ